MNTIKITIALVNKEYVEKRIGKLNNRAKRMNKEPLQVSYSDTYVKYVLAEIQDKDDEVKIPVEVTDVEINQTEELKIQGYDIIAKIDHEYRYAGNEYNKVDIFNNELATKELREAWKTVSSKCDHCNTNRRRLVTYILYSKEENKMVQVGKSCLSNYIGYDVSFILSYYDLLKEIEHYKGIDTTLFTGCSYCFFPLVDLVGLAKDIIDRNGYVSVSKAYESNTLHSTVGLVKDEVQKQFSKFGCLKGIEDEKELKIVNSMIDWGKQINTTNEYMEKLRSVCEMDLIQYSEAGIAAGLVKAYYDHLSKEEANKNNVNEYIGNVGDKKVKLDVTFTKGISFPGQWGNTYIYLFKDVDGKTVKWASSKYIDLRIGDKVLLEGTIKAHEEYNGTKQTVMTRCKVTIKNVD